MTGWLERNRGHILVLLLSLLAIAGAHFWIPGGSSEQPGAITVVPPETTPTPALAPTATPKPLKVYVSGAVVSPDVYELPPDSIVKDAVAAAGGFAADADRERLNLAKALRDGEQVQVPRRGEPGQPTAPPDTLPAATAPGGRVSINAATAQEIETLPGVGPVLAQRIVEYRTAHGPFHSIEEIKNVSGIGEAVFNKIKDLIEL